MIKKMNKMLRNKKGFTLVELIVVIAVLGILAGVAVPKYSGMKDKARQANDQQVIISLQHAMELFKAESETDSYPSKVDEARKAANFAFEDVPHPEQKGTNMHFYFNTATNKVEVKAASDATPAAQYLQLDE